MDMEILNVIQKVGTIPGQGSMLEQIDKVLRKQQRTNLFVMLEQIDENAIEDFPVILYKSLPQNGKRKPAVLRFFLPKWQGYDEVFWQALGDYIVLAVHRVTDVDYDRLRGKIKVHYFAKSKGRIKSPEHIRSIIQRLAFLIDAEDLPTDFTRFRSMAERRGQIGELSKEQAAIIGVALKFLPKV
jgi:hypothetical protein